MRKSTEADKERREWSEARKKNVDALRNLLIDSGAKNIRENEMWDPEEYGGRGIRLEYWATKKGLLLIQTNMEHDIDEAPLNMGYDVYTPITPSNKVEDTQIALQEFLDGK